MIAMSLLIKGVLVAIALTAAIAGYYYFGSGSPIEQELVKVAEEVVKEETGIEVDLPNEKKPNN